MGAMNNTIHVPLTLMPPVPVNVTFFVAVAALIVTIFVSTRLLEFRQPAGGSLEITQVRIHFSDDGERLLLIERSYSFIVIP